MSRRNRNKNKSKKTSVVKPETTPIIEVKELKNTIKNGPSKLRFSPTAWAKLLFMRDAAKTEVGGFGITPEDDLLYVEDFVLPKQKCTRASVEFNDESVADLMDDMIDKGYHPKQFMRIWIHTHPNMSASPSITDENTFERVFGECDWAVMAILSTNGDKYCRLQINGGPFPGAFQIPMEVDYDTYDFPASDSHAWLEEHTEKVEEEKWVVGDWWKKYQYGNYGEYHVGFPGKGYVPPASCNPHDKPTQMAIDDDDDDFEFDEDDIENYINVTGCSREDCIDAIEEAGYDASDFDMDFDDIDDLPKDLIEMLDPNQLSLLMNMSPELREYAIDDLKKKHKLGD